MPTMCANSMLGYLFVCPSGSLRSYCIINWPKIILISLAAKKRPGHAWRPYPKFRLLELTLTNWLSAPLSFDVSLACWRILWNLNGSNSSGFEKTSGSELMATAGTSIVTPAGTVRPSERVNGRSTLRWKEAAGSHVSMRLASTVCKSSC